MALQPKYARAEVLSTHWSADRVEGARLASIGKTASLLENTKHDKFLTDEGYLYVTVRAISSRVNRNNDSWPSEELQKSYRTFQGKPIFVDHNNHDPKRARGVVVDTAIHVDDAKLSALDPFYSSSQCESYHNPPTWVELLLEVDAKSFPKLASAFIEGKIDSVSMGALVEYSDCNICNNRAYDPQQFCGHIVSKGAEFNYVDQKTGNRASKKSAEVCREITFFEISAVFDPADTTALVKGIKAAAITPGERETIDRDPQTFADGDGIRCRGCGHKRQDDGGERCSLCGTAFSFDPNAERNAHVAHDTEVEMAAEEQMPNFRNPEDQNLIIEARQSYQQAISEGADNNLAIRSALSALKQAGIDMNRATDVVRVAVGEHVASTKTADRGNDAPQADLQTAPDMIDTLKQERPCPVCGSDSMTDGSCSVCFYVEPPEGFDNPDLDRAKQIEDALDQSKAENALEQQSAQEPGMAPGNGTPQAPSAQSAPPQQMAASVSHPEIVGDTNVSVEQTAKIASDLSGGRVNPRETPILPPGRKPSDKPKDIQVKKDYMKPVESHYRILAAEAPAGQGADARVDGGGKGGVGLDTDHAKKEDVGRESDIERIHTKTWSGNEGDSLGQQDPVTDTAFEPFKAASASCCDDEGCDGSCDACKEHEAAIKQADAVPAAGNAGWPDHKPSKVDLEGDLKEEVGPPTQTWGDNGDSLGQQDPVTKEVFEPFKAAAVAEGRAHMIACFKLAETEVALGITAPEAKFARVGELEDTPMESLKASLDALVRARKANAVSVAPARKTVVNAPTPVGATRTASAESLSGRLAAELALD